MKKLISPGLAFLWLFVFVSACNNASNNNPVTTCSDGIQNQNETGVDCGGPCPACIVTPTGYYLTGQLQGVSTSASGNNAALPSGSSYYGSSNQHRSVSAGGVWYSPSYAVKGSLIMHKISLTTAHNLLQQSYTLYMLPAPMAIALTTEPQRELNLV